MTLFSSVSNRGWSEGPVADAVTVTSRILLTGWEGTLAPLAASPQRTPAPEALKVAVEPLLGTARSAAAAVMEQSGLTLRSGVLALEPPIVDLGRALEAVIAASVLVTSRETDRIAVPDFTVRITDWAGIGGRQAEKYARCVLLDWIRGFELFAHRLAKDRLRLAGWMGDAALPQVESIQATASDVHGSSGAVLLVGFEGGGSVFYKPRSVSGELLWAELIAAVAGVDGEIAPAAAEVLPGGAGWSDGRGLPREWDEAASYGSSYGWMAPLQAGVCEPRRHWTRAGALLCLAQYAGLSDLHMGNVLATGEGPAVLDAECLGAARCAQRAGNEGLTECLLATGLLPAAETGSAPNVSGLFGGAAICADVLVPTWGETHDGRAEMRFVGARLLEQGNRHAAQPSPLACLPEMLEGYDRARRALLQVQAGLLARCGWVDRLATSHAPRVVVRSTLSYGLLMSRLLLARSDGWADDGRADGGSGEGDRSGLLRQWLVETPCALGATITPDLLDAEVDALRRLQVPRFHLRNSYREGAAGACDLVSEAGLVVVEGVQGSTPGAMIRARLASLSDDPGEHEAGDVLASILFRAAQLR